MKKNKEIYVKDLIALCYIIDEFDKFNKELKELYIQNGDLYSQSFDINKLSKNEYVFGKKNIKDFYLSNKNIIENIQNHLSIQDFVYNSYNSLGEPNYNILYFHNYLMEHRNEINIILDLLFELNKLGFKSLYFDSNIDFSKNDYEIAMNFEHNFNIYYLENMVSIPNYDQNTVKYKSLGSNYEIIVKPHLNEEISFYDRKIKLNSLIFDYNKLPKELSKENIFDKILTLKKDREKELVVNSVKLSVCVYDLKSQFEITEQIIKEIDSVEDKVELVKLLGTIGGSIKQLLSICNKYDNNIEENNESITREILEKEKQIYLRKRFYNSTDID